MFISWLKDNINLGLVRKKLIDLYRAFVHHRHPLENKEETLPRLHRDGPSKLPAPAFSDAPHVGALWKIDSPPRREVAAMELVEVIDEVERRHPQLC